MKYHATAVQPDPAAAHDRLTRLITEIRALECLLKSPALQQSDAYGCAMLLSRLTVDLQSVADGLLAPGLSLDEPVLKPNGWQEESESLK